MITSISRPTFVIPRQARARLDEQLEAANDKRDSEETIQVEQSASNTREEEGDGWKLSKKTGKIFRMEPDSDETKAVKTEVVV